MREAVRDPATIAVAALLGTVTVARFGVRPVLPALLFMVVIGSVLGRIDLTVRRLPFALTVPIFPVSALLLLASRSWVGADLTRAFASAAGWLVLYALIHLGSRGRGMGLGDVVLAPTLGLVLGWVGWGASVVGLAAGFGLGAIAAVVLLLAGRIGTDRALAFGPFMLFGAWLGAIAGPAIWLAYLLAGR